ncbi:MAG TPA: AAA family ATPase, partial [Polyangiaceae bacterium]|nr:AAA family ATPase [Polyangiaceae bacterium]
MHDSRRLHRDLKPANVLVCRADGRVVICDFGLVADNTARSRASFRPSEPLIAEESSSSTNRGEIAGTLAFMSPEQAVGGALLTPASDWYAVGVMLYQALTLRVPFDPHLPWDEVVKAKREQVPPHPRAISPDAPEDLSDLAMALLDTDPTRRAGYRGVMSVVAGPVAAAEQRAGLPEVMIGREDALAKLDAVLAATRGNAPAVALVSGPSGMGKSALVRRFLAQCAHQGALVLQGRCYEREHLPHKAVDPLIDALSTLLLSLGDAAPLDRMLPGDLAALRQLFPVLSRVSAIGDSGGEGDTDDPVSRRQRAAHAFRQICRRLAEERPLILFIDDIQWGDLDSGAFFAELLRAPDAPPLLLLCAYRKENEADGELIAALRDRYLRDSGVREIVELEIGPLRAADAERLARTLLRDASIPAAGIEAIVHEAQGSPFFLRELCAFVRAHDAGHDPSLCLSTVIEDRIRSLPAAAQALLDMIAVAGRPELQTVIDAASALGPTAFAAAQVLAAQNLIQTSGTGAATRVEAYHDRIRETVYGALSDERRREAHRRLAGCLERSASADSPQRDAEALLTHWRNAGEYARAAEYAVAAAQNAERALAFLHAARLYEQALELLPSGTEQRSQLQEQLGHALAFAGRGAAAAEALLRAREGAGRERAQELQREALTQLLRAGQFARAFKGLEEAQDVLGVPFPRGTASGILQLLWRRARIKLTDEHLPREGGRSSIEATRQFDNLHRVSIALASVDILRGAVYTSELTLRALRTGDVRQLALALSLEAMRSATANDKPERTAWLTQRTHALGARVDDPYVRAVIEGTTGAIRYLEGRFEESIPHSQRATRL